MAHINIQTTKPSRRYSARRPQPEFMCWGCSEHGQTANASSKDVQCQVGVLGKFSGKTRETSVKLAACGSSHTIIVTYTNSIYVWGNGHCGQLGINDTETYREPREIQLYALQSENPSIQGVTCGGKHTFVWLANGHMFSFGNNSYGQLGYDHKIKNYKENQKRPHLLRTLTHRCVTQIACGQKHTAMLFKDGGVATVGNGASGQIGDDSRSEAVTPKQPGNMPAIVYIAAGAFHTIAIDVLGEVWTWGLGQACGGKNTDVLTPERRDLPRPNAIMVDGGQTHSVALTANGNVYSWGGGRDGQLGHGPDCRYLSSPHRLQCQYLRNRVVNIACGDAFTTAITETGELFMWGRASHVMCHEKGPSHPVWTPQMINTGGRPIKHIYCGAWHVCAVTGRPEWRQADNGSDIEESQVLVGEDFDSDSFGESDDEIPEKPPLFSREKTAISLADFYAPSPSPTGPGMSPSPDSMIGKRKNYYKGLPPPKGAKRRHSKEKSLLAPDRKASLEPVSRSKEDFSVSTSRRASRDSDGFAHDVPPRKPSLPMNQFTYSDSRKQSLASDTQYESGLKQARQVTFVDDGFDAEPGPEVVNENSSRNSPIRVGPGLPQSDRMRSPLKMNNSSAVDFSKEAKLGSIRRQSSRNSSIDTTHDNDGESKTTNTHLTNVGKINQASSPVFRPNSILKPNKLKQQIIDHTPQISKHSIPFKDTRNMLGPRSVSFAQAPQLVQDTSKKMPRLERESSTLRQSLIEFPNTAERSPKFRKITQPLRVDTVYRQTTSIKSRDGKTTANYVSHFSKPDPPTILKPLLMNNIFAKGLKEIRHSNHSYLLSETARPAYETHLHQNPLQKQPQRPTTDRSSQANRNKHGSRRALGTISTENMSSDKWPIHDMYTSASEGNSPSSTAYKPRSLDNLRKGGIRGISSRHSLATNSRMRSQKPLWSNRSQQTSFV